MALLIGCLNAVQLQLKIVDLEFKKEIFLSSKAQIGEVYNIRHEIKAREVQISELRGRLDQLMSSLPETEQRGMASAIHSQQTRPLISSLPYEILSSVFKKGPIDSWNRTTFALSVSQVSRYWREIAVQTPFLWSGVCLLPWRTGTGYRKFLQILLQRSQSHALNIRLTLLASHNPSSRRLWPMMLEFAGAQSHLPKIPRGLSQPAVDHCLQDQLSMFIPEVSRWRAFNYQCDDGDDVLQITGHLADLSAPILESFYLDVTVNNDYMERRNIFQGGAPKLSHVHIGSILPFTCLPPLSSITTLRLAKSGTDPMTGGEFLNMLRSMLTLESLHLEGEVFEVYELYSHGLAGEYVEIPTVHSFSFSAIASPKYFIETILNTIRCPAIESMTISAHESDRLIHPFEPSSLQALPLPSFPLLRSMELHGMSCGKFSKNFNFFHHSPLQTISLLLCSFPMSFLRPLLPSTDGVDVGFVWPALQTIELSRIGEKEVEGICRIISHRHACGKPIEAISIDPISLENFPDEVENMKQYVTVRSGRGFELYPPELTVFQTIERA
jgi:hypothetical protein